MAEKIIRKNFSNYSAWHYRGKLMPRLYERRESRYVLPLERIISDLDMLKHAFFTDPNDQSPWNYHEWLISLVTPIQVVALVVNEPKTIEIGLSAQVRNLHKLEILLTDEQGSPIPYTLEARNSRDLSYSWLIKL
jgi:hypothetical protein